MLTSHLVLSSLKLQLKPHDGLELTDGFGNQHVDLIRLIIDWLETIVALSPAGLQRHDPAHLWVALEASRLLQKFVRLVQKGVNVVMHGLVCT